MDSPLLIHIPHSSEYIPGDCRREMTLSDEALGEELARMTDRYTDELFTPERAAALRFPVSRLVCDPERFRSDAEEPMSAVGMGAAYSRTSTGIPYRALSPERREDLLRSYYDLHHALLTAMTRERLAGFGRCVILDCHSFSGEPLPYESDRALPRPDFCIGTDDCHTPPELRDLCVDLLRGEGFSVRVNSPYGGALVPSAFYRRDKRVMAVMVELNRSAYLTPDGGKSPDFEAVRAAALGLVGAVRIWSLQMSPGGRPGGSRSCV